MSIYLPSFWKHIKIFNYIKMDLLIHHLYKSVGSKRLNEAALRSFCVSCLKK